MNLTKRGTVPKRLRGQVERRTPDDLRDIAQKIVMGQVFIPRPDDVDLTFPIFAMSPRMTKPFAKSIGLVFEDLARAAPRTVNGLPMLVQFVHVDDVPILKDLVAKFEAALKSVEATA